MIHLKKYNQFQLFESNAYQWAKNKNNKYQEGTHFEYLFSDEFGNEFKVEIERESPSSNEVEMRYLVKDDDNWTYKKVKTNIWKVTETRLGGILNDFIKNNNWCKSIKIVGLGKGNEREEITQRTKNTWRYLTQHPIEGWALDRYINEIYLDKIENINEGYDEDAFLEENKEDIQNIKDILQEYIDEYHIDMLDDDVDNGTFYHFIMKNIGNLPDENGTIWIDPTDTNPNMSIRTVKLVVLMIGTEFTKKYVDVLSDMHKFCHRLKNAGYENKLIEWKCNTATTKIIDIYIDI